MKKLLQSLFIIVSALILAIGAPAVVNATVTNDSNFNTCTITAMSDASEASDMKYMLETHHCKTITLGTNVTLKGSYNLGTAKLNLASYTLTIDGGKITLDQNVTDTPLITMTQSGAGLNIINGGTLDISNFKLYAITAIPNGKITLDKGTLYIHDSNGSGINNPASVDVKNGSSLRIENLGGYGLTTSGVIDIDNSNVVVKNNKAGITGVIKLDDKSTLTATGNGKIGITTKPGSELEGIVTATGNGTDTSIAENQRGDLAVNGELTITGNVTADKIVSETRKEYGDETPDIKVEDNGSLSYEEIDSAVPTPVVTSGVLTGEDSIVVDFNTTKDAHDIVISKTTKVTNYSPFPINVCTTDSKVCASIDTGDSAEVTVYNVTFVNGKTETVYSIIRGSKVTDLKAYESIVKAEGFKALLKANGKEYDVDDAVNADLTLTISTTATTTKPEVEVPNTFDPGIAGYVTALLADLGVGAALLKKFR